MHPSSSLSSIISYFIAFLFSAVFRILSPCGTPPIPLTLALSADYVTKPSDRILPDTKKLEGYLLLLLLFKEM